MIRIYDRKNNQYFTEQVAAGGLLKLLYGKSRLGEKLAAGRALNAVCGMAADLRISRFFIRSFAQKHGIPVPEGANYQSFNQFFYRQLPRPFAEGFCSPGDGRLKAWQNISADELWQVKGSSYALADLLGDREAAARYEGGVCLLLRLAPVDYHRFHFVADGVCTKAKVLGTRYDSVNPQALNTRPRIFCENRRQVSYLDTASLGRIAYVEVGAAAVGSIIQSYEPGKPVVRGAVKGKFAFGGSTVLLFVERGKIRVDEDILSHTLADEECLVQAGEKIACIQ